MTETYWCPGPWPWQWFRMCTREVSECAAAKARLDGARTRFRSNCSAIQALRHIADLLRNALSSPFIIVIVIVAAIAALLGGPILGAVSAFLWTVVLIYGISWFLYFVVVAMMAAFGVALGQAAIEMQKALKDVLTNCGVDEQGDLSIPTCPPAP